MITYILVTLIVTAIIVGGHIRKHFQNKNRFDKMNKNPAVQEMKGLFDLVKEMNEQDEDGTDQDMIPNGYGEFGYDLTNPIPVNTVYGNTAYLAKLRTLDNIKVSYERMGSLSSPVSKHPVDAYKISANEKLCGTMYISPYHKKNSEKAPANFKLLADQPMLSKRKTGRDYFVALTALSIINIVFFLLSKMFCEISLLNCLLYSLVNAVGMYFLLLPVLERNFKNEFT